MNENNVIVIPRTIPAAIDQQTGDIRKKRVAAYCRVSTDMDDQLNSLETQKNEFSSKIQENPKWEFVGLFYDEGITGTCLDKREGFNKMIACALEGQIDLILVKSISRFARNTVDCIKTKRDLEAVGVEVFFEKENISSLDSASETMLTIYASFAQEESRQISTNVTWGVRSRMKTGSYRCCHRVLGYTIDKNNNFKINPEERETVEKIFMLFLNGYRYREIVDAMIKEQRKCINGTCDWKLSHIDRILSNEKYCGDFIYQKTYCKSYLTHERVVNNGEVEQYLIPKHHEAIIPKEIFMYVQELRKFRKKSYDPVIDSTSNSPLAGLVQCAECGRNLQKINYKRGNYSKRVLTCKYTSRNKINYKQCSVSTTLDYDLLYEFVADMIQKEMVVDDSSVVFDSINKATFISNYQSQTERLKRKIGELEKSLTKLVENQIKKNLPVASFQKEYDAIQSEIKAYKKTLNDLGLSNFNKVENTNFMRDLATFSKNKAHLTQKLISNFIKKIYRLSDGTLLVVKAKETLKTETIEKIRNNIDQYLGTQINAFSCDFGTIQYRVLNWEEKENE